MSQKYSSSYTSKSSTFIGHHRQSQMVRQIPTTSEIDGELALATYINGLQLDTFFQQLTEDEQEERLAKIDSLELFEALQEINRQLAKCRLENHILTDFLGKNDTKLLIGLKKRRATAQSVQFSTMKIGRDPAVASQSMIDGGGGGSSVGFRTRGTYSRSMMTTTMSMNTLGSQKKAAAYEYKLNVRAKTDMAEKTANKVEKRVKEIERNASHEIKLLRGHLEELRFMFVETQDTIKNFELHFLRDEQDLVFLNTATEKQLERKFKKFINNWIKNARASLATMRLKTSSLQEHCQQLRSELLTKSDLSGILTSIDFEKLTIKRTELLNSLEEKNIHMAGLKEVTGRASLSMAEEKQIMMNVEEESKKLINKSMEVAKTIGKLEKELYNVEMEYEKDVSTLKSLKNQLEHFEAPSVTDYIEKKNEVLALEKEEKMLQRKIYILNMKLDNARKTFKRKTESSSYVFINQIEE